MQEYFENFIENISLTKNQRDDAITKYEGVCKCLNEEFYDSEYSDSVKFLFGSYKKKTTISHPNKDVDVIFKISKDKFKEYESQENGPSNLLTKIKNTLKDKYTATDNIKNWTKVVLVDFQSFKVEVLPALEQKNGKFTIPNSGNGEDWIIDFDPKKEIDDFFRSSNSNDKLTRKLIKIIKKWKLETSNVKIKSYILDNYVIDFLDNYSFLNYPKLILDFFEYLYKKENATNVETAKNRAQNAYKYYKEDNFLEAAKEYKKNFSDKSFTSPDIAKDVILSFGEIVKKLQAQYPTNTEEYLDKNYGIEFNINPNYLVKVDVLINQNGWRSNHWLLSEFQKYSYRILKKASLKFKIMYNNIPEPYEVKWKVRNFGEEAKGLDALRGEITDDLGKKEKEESTLYHGEHYVECYIIKNNQCVAIADVFVPIQ